MALYGAIVYDFVKDNALEEVIGPLAAVYVAVLAIYAGEKEFERWTYLHKSSRPGEIFILAWTLLILAVIAADTILEKPYKFPGEVISAYIAVLGILAITSKSKSIYSEKENEKKEGEKDQPVVK